MFSKETELTFYGKVGDFSGFDQAVSMEVQSQFSFDLPSDGIHSTGRTRVRSTAIDGQIKYEETIKTSQYDEESHCAKCEEFTTDIDEEYFEAWKKAFKVKGVNKIRYVFLSKNVDLDTGNNEILKLPELKFEVDVFLDKEGNKSKWCKIDIEIDNLLDYLKEQHKDIKRFDVLVKLSSLPINLEHSFSSSTENEEEKKAISHFWEVFSYLPGADRNE